jgi:MHS family proline/betaine transporter-like MFS transporter
MRAGRVTRHPTTAQPGPIVARRAFVASCAGTAVEYYDWVVYGSLAVVLAPLFFPRSSEAAALLSTLVLVGAGFVARPLGGAVFGRLGDRRGRRVVLLVTVVGMGAATVLTGLLPTHADAGTWAPALLATLRLAQGLFTGGEVGGAVALVAESAPSRRRGLFGSAPAVGTAIGTVGAAVTVGLVSTATTPEQMAAWGWRVPFLVAAPLLVVSLGYRLRVEDSPLFRELMAGSGPAKAPITDVLLRHTGSTARVLGLGFGLVVVGNLVQGYLVVHLTANLGYTLGRAIWVTALVAAVPIVVMPVAGAMSDRFGRRRTLCAGFLGSAVLAVPCFLLMQQHNLALALLAGVLLDLPYGIIIGTVFTQFAELFPTSVRYTGVSVGFNIASVVGAAPLAPVATLLVLRTHIPFSPALYMIFGAAVGLATLATMHDTSGEDLRAVR